jgi:glycosyltransferase involved in cell wall biosynthesis
MTHIVIDARISRTTTGRYVDKLIEHLQELDLTTKYTLIMKPVAAKTWPNLNANFSIVESSAKEFTFAEQIHLARQVYSLKADLVHWTAAHQPVLYLRPSITTIHDLTMLRFVNTLGSRWIFKAKQAAYYLLHWSVCVKTKGVITVSTFVKNDLSMQFPVVRRRPICVVSQAADLIAESSPIAVLEGQRFCFFVGTHQPHKNLKRLIDAFAIVRNKDTKLRLAIVGKPDRSTPELIEYATVRGLAESVVFTGLISDQQLRWAYENCRAYVFPSLSEGFGLPGLEAMLHGAPVVSSSATCLPEVYGDGAHYFDPEDVENMATAISSVINDEELRMDLVARGRTAAAKYSWKRTATDTRTAYFEALKIVDCQK